MADLKYFTCNLCDALCGLEATVERNRVTAIRGDAADVFSHGHICPKGHALRELLEDPRRLRQPVRRTGDTWTPIGWDEALDECAAHLRAIRERYGNDAVGIYVGNPTAHSHRAALGSQLLTIALGTKNRFDPNSQDSNPRLYACTEIYGDGLAMTVPDVDRTDYLLMVGANPAASNGSQMALGDARARLRALRARGGKVVLIDPRRTETAAWADEHCFIRPGGDALFFLALFQVLFAENRVDRARIREMSTGLEQIEEAAREYSPEGVGPAIGMSAEQIRSIARELADAPRAAVYARVGVCQNEFGPLAAWLVEVLNIVTGNFDREGGMMFPKPAVDLGPLARLLKGDHFGRWRSRVRGLPEFLGSLPSAVIAEEIETPGSGQIRGFVCFAGNPVLTTPNGARLDRALPVLDFMVGIDFYINETTRHASIVLPPMTVLESGNYDLFMLGLAARNLAKYSPPILSAEPSARDDWDILSDLALRFRLSAPRFLQRAWRRILRSLPEHAMDLLLRFGAYRLSLKELRKHPHGLDLGPLLPAGKQRIHTPDQRARLAPPSLIAHLPRLKVWMEEQRSAGLVLIGRRHLRSNNSWMNGIHTLSKGPVRSKLYVHPKDAQRFGITSEMRVSVESRTGCLAVEVEITEDVMPGVVSLPHGFSVPNVNAITDELFVEPILGTSILNGVPVTLRRATGE
jgi:anaerobic selenocysteine-containing dehydrogenase